MRSVDLAPEPMKSKCRRVEILRCLAGAEAGEIHRRGGVEGVALLVVGDLHDVALHAVVRVERQRALALVPACRVPEVVRDVGDHQAVALCLRLQAAGGEEPQLVTHDRPAERVLVRRDDVIQAGVLVGRVVGDRLVFEGGQPAPLVVVQRAAVRAREVVAARLGDHVDDTAREPAELSRHTAARDRRLLDGVFDIEHVRLTAQVLVDGHAVDHEQVLERHRSGNGVAAARTGRVHRRRHQDGGADVTVGRQVLHQRLLEGGGDRR
jgi:hypothetical protein